ncbi:MAG: hypothetical protein JW384_04081 [Nitrosomonadaceae bacterium]|nr:hypothetical protein [Nitrosomonadaceae bacterium]
MENGVYQIRNLTNGKRYIGSAASSEGFVGRWRRHLNAINGGYHHSIHLQRAWNKNGVESFIFEILLVCSPQDCLMYEQVALDYYKPEYNICRVAGNRTGMRHTESSKEKMRIAKLGLYDGSSHPMYGKNHTTDSNIKNALGHAKLSVRDVLIIKRASRFGISQKKIAARFGVSRSTIGDIQHNRCWRAF